VRAVRAEIGFRGPEHRRRAWTFGSPFDVWEVVQAWQDLQQDVGKAQAQLELTHNVKDFPEILRDWADEGREHAGCIILVGIHLGQFGPLIRSIEAALACAPDQHGWSNRSLFVGRQ